MDTASKLFKSESLTLLLRLFLFNPGVIFDRELLKKRIGLECRKISKELSLLKKLGLISERLLLSGGKRGPRFTLNRAFPYTESLRSFLRDTAPVQDSSLRERFGKVKGVKLLVTAGFFVDSPESRLDLLLVGDKLKRSLVDKVVRALELSCARELRYAVLSVSDFNYRLDIYDKLIRDVFDYPHRVVSDRLGISAHLGLSTRRLPVGV